MARSDHDLAPLPPKNLWLERVKATLARRSEPLGNVYLLIDCSTSMADGKKLLQAKRGALRFAIEAWERRYAVGVIRFATRPAYVMRPRLDAYYLPRRLEGLEPEGRTAMASAIYMAARGLRRRKGERVIFVITDGMPDSREATLHAAGLARAWGITVIAVGTDGADEVFLASLTPREGLAVKVPRGALEDGVAAMARVLPEKTTS